MKTYMTYYEKREAKLAHRDPITGTPGAHPVGVGLGATTGAATGAFFGGVTGGPVGMAVGAVIGGVIGGMAGKEAAENFDPTWNDTYWRENLMTASYYLPGTPYDDYVPAYKYGIENSKAYVGLGWDDVEPKLAARWEESKDTSTLTWMQARPAVKDAWDQTRDKLRNPDHNTVTDPLVQVEDHPMPKKPLQD
jgi:hypothetical protein